MSKYFTMTNFWIFVGVIGLCIAPWITLAVAVAFIAGVVCFAKIRSEPEPVDPDSTVEWPAIEYPNLTADSTVECPNLTAALAEEKAVAEARAAKAKAEYEEKAARHFTYFKIAAPVLIACVLVSNYIDETKTPVETTQTTCVKNSAGNTECSYVKK